jgi:hypothetical protein
MYTCGMGSTLYIICQYRYIYFTILLLKYAMQKQPVNEIFKSNN